MDNQKGNNQNKLQIKYSYINKWFKLKKDFQKHLFFNFMQYCVVYR